MAHTRKRHTHRRHTLAAACLLLVGFGAGCQTGRPAATTTLNQPKFQSQTDPAFQPLPPANRPSVPPVAKGGVTPPTKATPVPPRKPSSMYAGIPEAWVPDVATRDWKWIVIHHSDTTVGGAARFHKAHVQEKKWDELGYHFVIGNGTDTANGLVEVGPRWPKQKQGAHCKTPDNDYNDRGIGVCLVGDFEVSKPTDAQLRSTAKLVAFLMRQYKIPPERVIGHGTAKATKCPGAHLKIADVRRMSVQMLADAGEPIPASAHAAAAGTELMVDVK